MSSPVSHEQLAMYMTAPEIKERYRAFPADVRQAGGEDNMWENKRNVAMTGKPSNSRAEATGETLAQNIKREGIKQPVILGKDNILSGHHRVAAAEAVDPKMPIPVWHE